MFSCIKHCVVEVYTLPSALLVYRPGTSWSLTPSIPVGRNSLQLGSEVVLVKSSVTFLGDFWEGYSGLARELYEWTYLLWMIGEREMEASMV